MDSYWGGGVAALGGALVFGAIPRVLEGATIRHSLIAGVGTALSLTTRPYESVFFLAFVLGWVLWRAKSAGLWHRLPSALLPGAVVVVATGLFMCYQDLRVTGNPLRLPYIEVQHQYGVNQPLIFFPDVFVSGVRDRQITAEAATQIRFHKRLRTIPGFLAKEAGWLRTTWRCFLGFLPLPPLLWAWAARRQLAFFVAFGAITVVALANALYGYFFGHYDAPLAVAWLLLMMIGWRQMRCWKYHGRPVGLAFSRALSISVVLSPWVLYAARAAEPIWPSLQTWNRRVEDEFSVHNNRALTLACLEAQPGRQLAIVRTPPSSRDPGPEWVYNSADMNSQRVLWADDLGEAENRTLMRHFSGRTVWLIESDEDPVRIAPLSGQAAIKCPGLR